MLFYLLPLHRISELERHWSFNDKFLVSLYFDFMFSRGLNLDGIKILTGPREDGFVILSVSISVHL
jgi:hypothetical protein